MRTSSQPAVSVELAIDVPAEKVWTHLTLPMARLFNCFSSTNGCESTTSHDWNLDPKSTDSIESEHGAIKDAGI